MTHPLRTVRLCLAVVMFGLLVSGVTAFPLQTEMSGIARPLSIPAGVPPAQFSGLKHWIAVVNEGLTQTNARYPFLAYGTDWLAFAHLILAVLFVGPYLDPVRNVWVIDFGPISCVGVVLLANIAGPLRGIPFAWRCIDGSFGLLAAVPLLIARRGVSKLAA